MADEHTGHVHFTQHPVDEDGAEWQARRAIRAALHETGTKQIELAKFLGVTQKHISEVLGGHSGLSFSLAERALAAFGRRMSVLVTEDRQSAGGPWTRYGHSVVDGPWTRHGHSVDGVTRNGPNRPPVARCGGPGLCSTCAVDAERIRQGATGTP